MATLDPKDRSYILWLLSRRDYSRRQLEEKLKKRGAALPEITETLDELAGRGLFNEKAFAAGRTRSLIRKGLGRGLIRSRLRWERVEVTEESLADGYHQVGTTAEDQIRALLRKQLRKIARLAPSDRAKAQQKVIQSIMQKGHGYAEVKKILEIELAEPP